MVDISHSEIVLQKHIEISIFFLMYFFKTFIYWIQLGQEYLYFPHYDLMTICNFLK